MLRRVIVQLKENSQLVLLLLITRINRKILLLNVSHVSNDSCMCVSTVSCTEKYAKYSRYIHNCLYEVPYLCDLDPQLHMITSCSDLA